ncbi:MAG: pimeloyl-ACP methyl ester carboxylesterase [Myxococcota bacterium]|jgi:pimeloyl-ACP methyl ester carboxylesterase
MQTGQTLRGATRLAFDAVESVTDIVEGMYRNISAAPLPFGEEPQGSALGIAGFVHGAIRKVNGGVRDATDFALRPLSAPLDRVYPPGPQREAAVAALNGVCGDHLECSGNPLAIPLELRVFLASNRGTDPSDPAAKPLALYPRSKPQASGEVGFQATGRILVLAHGLCMNDRDWSWEGHNHGQELADAFDYTPVYLRYNSGRHISTNGREFAAALEQLVVDWPVPIESLTLVGFSMGGLVTRSALQIAEEQRLGWFGKVDRVAYVSTPHHGAVMERGGFWLHKSMTFSPYTAPLAALARIRSTGITDLRHGNVLEADWQGHDTHVDNSDRRQPVPLAPGIEHYALAATLSKQPGERIGRLLGDGLVHPSSATGRHANPQRDLSFDESHVRILYGQSHLGMLSDPRVSDCLRGWLGK